MSNYEMARRLFDLGWVPVPMYEGSKRPMVKRWSELADAYDASVFGLFKRKANLAVVCSGFVDVDIEFGTVEDIEKLRDTRYQWLKSCPILKTRRGISVWLRCPEVMEHGRTIRYTFPSDPSRMLVEMRTGAGACRLAYGQVEGISYRFVQHDPAVEGLSPASLPVVDFSGLASFVADLASLSGIDIPAGHLALPVRARVSHHYDSAASAEDSAGSWIDQLLRSEKLFHEVFEKYSPLYPLGRRSEPVLCPFHEERNPSATWYVRPDKVIIFADFHGRAEDGEITFDIIDCYRAFKNGNSLMRIKDKRERVLWAARLAEEFGRLSDRGALAARDYDEVVGYLDELDITGADRRNMNRVLAFIRSRYLAQVQMGLDIFGDSVRYIGSAVGVDSSIVNRVIDLCCCLGIFEKTEVLSSKTERRPDRLRLRLVTRAHVHNAWAALKEAGVKCLRTLNQNRAFRALGLLVASIFRRQSDASERRGLKPPWARMFSLSYRGGNPLGSYVVDNTRVTDLPDLPIQYPLCC